MWGCRPAFPDYAGGVVAVCDVAEALALGFYLSPLAVYAAPRLPTMKWAEVATAGAGESSALTRFEGNMVMAPEMCFSKRERDSEVDGPEGKTSSGSPLFCHF